jgi:hypothetical protein
VHSRASGDSVAQLLTIYNSLHPYVIEKV